MLSVQDFPLGPLQTNCFLIYNQNEALVVDPGGEPDPVLDFLRRKNVSLVYILNTHFHFDHILGNRSLQESTQVPILASPEDDFLLQAQVGGGGGMMGFPSVESFEYQALYPGSYTWLGEECQVLETPGHTPGSLSFYFPQSAMIFSGDLLFSRSVGRTDFPGGSTQALLQAVKEKVFTLPEKTVIYAGHGPQTTVHEEKLFNPFFQEGFFL